MNSVCIWLKCIHFTAETPNKVAYHTIMSHWRLWKSSVFVYMIYQAKSNFHYIDVIMTTMASQITSLIVVYSTVYSDAGQRKHQSSALLPFVWGYSPGPVNFPHKGPVTRKMFPFDDVIILKLRIQAFHPDIASLMDDMSFCLSKRAQILSNFGKQQ